jgi:hypothetical protein
MEVDPRSEPAIPPRFTRGVNSGHDGPCHPEHNPMSFLPRPYCGDDAHGRLRVLLGLPRLRRGGAATAGGLLRLLFLRLGPLPTQAAVLDAFQRQSAKSAAATS